VSTRAGRRCVLAGDEHVRVCQAACAAALTPCLCGVERLQVRGEISLRRLDTLLNEDVQVRAGKGAQCCSAAAASHAQTPPGAQAVHWQLPPVCAPTHPSCSALLAHARAHATHHYYDCRS
jgi:hypothetical protein